MLGIAGIICASIPPFGPIIAFVCIGIGLPMTVLGFVRNRRLGLRKRMAIFGTALHCVALVVAIVVLSVSIGESLTSFEDYTCDDLVDDVIGLSKEKATRKF